MQDDHSVEPERVAAPLRPDELHSFLASLSGIDVEVDSVDPVQFSPEPDLDREVGDFYRESFPRLSAVLQWSGASDTDALNSSHFAILKASSRWEVIRSPYSYCRRAALGRLLELRQARLNGSTEPAGPPFPNLERAAEKLAEVRRLHLHLELCNNLLSERQKIFSALHHDGCTAAEIATDLDLPVKVVREEIRRAQEILKKGIGKGSPDEQ